jgi:large subunit ribosomal protein L25
MEQFVFNAQRRTEFGKASTRRLRRAGHVPAIMYGAGKEPLPLMLSHNELIQQLEHESIYSRILTVNVEAQSEKAVIKALQRHPYRPTIMHLDFQRISDMTKLSMMIPLHLINEDKCEGLKQAGGILSRHLTEIEIRCLPKDLPEFIEIDLLPVKLNQIIHLSDLTLPEGLEVVSLISKENAHDLPVVSVHLPRGTQADEEKDSEESSEEESQDKQDKGN